MLDLDVDHISVLQHLKHTIQNTVFCPAIGARINTVPMAKSLRQIALVSQAAAKGFSSLLHYFSQLWVVVNQHTLKLRSKIKGCIFLRVSYMPYKAVGTAIGNLYIIGDIAFPGRVDRGIESFYNELSDPESQDLWLRALSRRPYDW